jgi:hypothetical protein
MENIFLPRGPVAANSLVVLPNASKKNIAQRQRLAFCRGLPQPHTPWRATSSRAQKASSSPLFDSPDLQVSDPIPGELLFMDNN